KRITFLRTGNVLPPDTYTVTLRSAASGFKVLVTGELLDGNADGTPGDNYTTTFTVASSAVVVSIPDFARGPGQSVDLPAGVGTGILLHLSDGVGVDSVDLKLLYDPALLSITDAQALTPGSSVVINLSTPGRAVLGFISPTALPAGPVDFVRLIAQVP